MKIMTKLVLGSAIAAMALTNLSAAQSDRSFGEIYTQCGIGGLLTSPLSSGIQQPLAVISNVVWDLGTTAISSNISSADTCAVKNVKVASFINSSYKELEKDLAMGEGKYLDSLVSMSKPENVKKEDFVAKVRSDFSKVVNSNEYAWLSDYQKSEKLYNIVVL